MSSIWEYVWSMRKNAIVPSEWGNSPNWRATVLKIMPWVFPLFSGLLALQLGKSAGYDFLIYHYFNGYAFDTGRTTADILPAGSHTFLNPVADGFLYLLMENFSARTCGFILGTIQGFNFVATAAVASCVLGYPRVGYQAYIPIFAAAAGFLGWENLNILGSFHHDNIVSIFFLVSLLIVCHQAPIAAPPNPRAFLRLTAAGAIVGVGLGLKLTLAPFAVAVGCGPLFYSWAVRQRLGGTAVFAVGGLVGLMAIAGAQMWHLYQEFGNPVFPFFHWLSRPPFDQFAELRETRFLPGSFVDYLFFPFLFAFNPYRADAADFTDYRLPIVYAVGLTFLGVLFLRWLRHRGARNDGGSTIWRHAPAATVFLGVVAISYVGWLCLFGYYRYSLPLELLSFVVLAVLLFDCLGERRGLVALLGLAAIIIATTRGFESERRTWGNQPFVDTQLPTTPNANPDAIVLVAGADTGSYFIPKFPASVRFFGIDVIDTYIPYSGQTAGLPAPDSMLGPFREMMHRAVSEHSGQVLGVFRSDDTARAERAFAVYGFVPKARSCGVIRSNVASRDPLRLCELARISGTRA